MSKHPVKRTVPDTERDDAAQVIGVENWLEGKSRLSRLLPARTKELAVILDEVQIRISKLRRIHKAESVLPNWKFMGFADTKLNDIYYGADDKPVGGQYTYWTAASDFFLYYPVGVQRWHISPKLDSHTGEDNYIKAKQGGVIGIAGQTPDGSWLEYVADEFQQRQGVIMMAVGGCGKAIPEGAQMCSRCCKDIEAQIIAETNFEGSDEPEGATVQDAPSVETGRTNAWDKKDSNASWDDQNKTWEAQNGTREKKESWDEKYQNSAASWDRKTESWDRKGSWDKKSSTASWDKKDETADKQEAWDEKGSAAFWGKTDETADKKEAWDKNGAAASWGKRDETADKKESWDKRGSAASWDRKDEIADKKESWDKKGSAVSWTKKDETADQKEAWSMKSWDKNESTSSWSNKHETWETKKAWEKPWDQKESPASLGKHGETWEKKKAWEKQAWDNKDSTDASDKQEHPERLVGTVKSVKAKFGFIIPDGGGGDIFVLPANCPNSIIPPAGTRVTYELATDKMTGRQRADNVLLASRDEGEAGDTNMLAFGDESEAGDTNEAEVACHKSDSKSKLAGNVQDAEEDAFMKLWQEEAGTPKESDDERLKFSQEETKAPKEMDDEFLKLCQEEAGSPKETSAEFMEPCLEKAGTSKKSDDACLQLSQEKTKTPKEIDDEFLNLCQEEAGTPKETSDECMKPCQAKAGTPKETDVGAADKSSFMEQLEAMLGEDE